MQVIRSVKSLQRLIQKAKARSQRIGFVPTMGALHDGHASLMRRCRKDNSLAVVSIFVNPKQFGPREDFRKYPRMEEADRILAKKAGVDILFCPSENEMYPDDHLTYIDVEKITKPLCGRSRPGHFRGVATVVGKLLNMVMPDVLYLGQKDAQQALIIKRMIRDLNFPVQVKVCPIVRDADGLALSSRNRYLTEKQRREAVILYQSLREAKKRILEGERRAPLSGRLRTGKIAGMIRSRVTRNTSGRIDYVECVDAETLESLTRAGGKIMIALAVHFGKTRLIDNMIVSLR